MALYEITIKGTKTFYVEAASQEEALEDSTVHDEMCHSDEFEWQADEAKANACNERDEKHAREHESHLIV